MWLFVVKNDAITIKELQEYNLTSQRRHIQRTRAAVPTPTAGLRSASTFQKNGAVYHIATYNNVKSQLTDVLILQVVHDGNSVPHRAETSPVWYV